MLEFIGEKKNCTGCSACLNTCTIGSISMKEDNEGFLYPVTDDRCIHCNKCKDICPIFSGKTERLPSIKQYSVAAITKNRYIWEKSTSGGAFTEICNTYGDQNTVVFGATFDGLKVIHSYVIGVENVGIFNKSKYIQSYLGDSFIKVEEFLKQGKKVIFSGTPCQIAGLRCYLKKEYDNLLCIDLICHGVGSPKVFMKVIEYLNKKYNCKIKKYTFRYKNVILGNFREYASNYTFEDNKTKIGELDEYNQLFLLQLCLRKSCQSNCKFRTSNRMGDITIADFKGRLKVFPDMEDYRNYSTIVVNTRIGDSIFSKLENNMNIIPCNLDVIKKYNPLFYRTTDDNPLRDKFFEDFTQGMEIKDLLKKYVRGGYKRKFSLFRDLIPYRTKIWIFKILEK